MINWRNESWDISAELIQKLPEITGRMYGQENIRDLTRDSFAVQVDASSIHSVVQVKDELTKNRRETNEAEEGGSMFEKIGDTLCPVALFEKYVSK